MKQFPSISRLGDAPPELLAGGHLWIQEKIDGANVRFGVRDSGLLVFGDRSDVYEGEVPEPYRHVARHVRENFDVDALRIAAEESDAIEDVADVVFFGEATHRHTIEYDFDRLPSFLGFDVWSASSETFLPPDAVERVFETFGLTPVNTFAREVRATDFDPGPTRFPSRRGETVPPKASSSGPRPVRGRNCSILTTRRSTRRYRWTATPLPSLGGT